MSSSQVNVDLVGCDVSVRSISPGQTVNFSANAKLNISSQESQVGGFEAVWFVDSERVASDGPWPLSRSFITLFESSSQSASVRAVSYQSLSEIVGTGQKSVTAQIRHNGTPIGTMDCGNITIERSTQRPNLSVDVDYPSSIVIGESFSIFVTVDNTGGAIGSIQIPVTVNGDALTQLGFGVRPRRSVTKKVTVQTYEHNISISVGRFVSDMIEVVGIPSSPEFVVTSDPILPSPEGERDKIRKGIVRPMTARVRNISTSDGTVGVTVSSSSGGVFIRKSGELVTTAHYDLPANTEDSIGVPVVFTNGGIQSFAASIAGKTFGKEVAVSEDGPTQGLPDIDGRVLVLGAGILGGAILLSRRKQ